MSRPKHVVSAFIPGGSYWQAVESTKGYETFADWRKGQTYFYNRAYYRGWITNILKDSGLEGMQQPKTLENIAAAEARQRITFEDCLKSAEPFANLKLWREALPEMSQYARDKNWIFDMVTERKK